MSRFGPTSLDRLETCHDEIVQVCFEVIPVYDFTIIWGARGEAEQNRAFDEKYSKVRWPDSKHNVVPPALSNAIDIAPWHTSVPHIRWDMEEEFIYLAGHIMQAAASLGIRLRWGGDWADQGSTDKVLSDINRPYDLGHFERRES